MAEWVKVQHAGMPVPADTLVHVQFRGERDLSDEHLPPLPASWWGPGWTAPFGKRIFAYRVFEQ